MSDYDYPGGSGQHGPPSHKQAKLTPAQRDEVAQRYGEGETAVSLALEFGVSAVTVRRYGSARRSS